ncbi:MAG: HAD hydrolase-like protein [Pirellulales bacterium]
MPINVVFFDLGDTLVQSSGSWVAGAKSLLADLRAGGLRLGIISNTGQLTRSQIVQLLPADFNLAIFESELVLFSSEVGVEKPGVGIFRTAVERAAIGAGQCLFCTENLVDTLAAQSVGMMAARIHKPPASDLPALVAALAQAGLLT